MTLPLTLDKKFQHSFSMHTKILSIHKKPMVIKKTK